MRIHHTPEGFAIELDSRGARSRTRSIRFGIGVLAQEDATVS